MVDKQKKLQRKHAMLQRHLTATISDSVYNMVEEYREQNKQLVKPERSQIVEDALIAYIKSKKPQT